MTTNVTTNQAILLPTEKDPKQTMNAVEPVATDASQEELFAFFSNWSHEQEETYFEEQGFLVIPPNDSYLPKGMTDVELQDLLNNGSEEEITEFWQSLSPEEVDAFLAQAPLDEVDSYLSHMSVEQANDFFSKANPEEAKYALAMLSDETLAYYTTPPYALSAAQLNAFLANVTPEEAELAEQLNELVGELLQAQADGNQALVMSTSAQISALAEEAYQYDIPYVHMNFWGISVAFMNWIDSINNLMGTVANGAATIAANSALYAGNLNEMLATAETGDSWDPNKNVYENPSKDTPGTGFETGYYVPGISEIPPDNEYAGYWESVANQNYQLIQTTYSSWISQTQTWSQNQSDIVQNASQSTQSDNSDIQALNGILGNMAALLR